MHRIFYQSNDEIYVDYHALVRVASEFGLHEQILNAMPSSINLTQHHQCGQYLVHVN